MFLRKRGLVLSILSIGLLVAILVATNSIINYVNLQTQTLKNLINPGNLYIILSKNSTAITDSQVDTELVNKLNNTSYVKYVLPQRIIIANLTTNFSTQTIHVRGVSNVEQFLKIRNAYLNGTSAKNLTECDVGELLAKTFSLNINDEINLSINNTNTTIKIVGIFKSQTQSDTEIIVPIETVNKLLKNNKTISLIELTLKDNTNIKEAINKITSILPQNVKLIHVQQLKEFTEQMNTQTLNFLNIWSLIVYTIVAITSYIIATKLVIESNYELFMIRALGAKKLYTFSFVLTYITLITFLGSTLGIALGITSTQIISTILRWIWPSIDITPFLNIQDTIQTLTLTLLSAIIGCIYPAFKSTHIKYMETQI